MCVKILKRCLGVGILLFLCFLSGCQGYRGEKPRPATYRVVQEIYITYRNGFGAVEHRYAGQEEMQQILNYLRWVDPYGTPAEDPMTQQGEEFLIRLYYSDGTTKNYHQRCDRYLRVGEGPWKRIVPERGQELKKLLGNLPGEKNHIAPYTCLLRLSLRLKLKWA